MLLWKLQLWLWLATSKAKQCVCFLPNLLKGFNYRKYKDQKSSAVLVDDVINVSIETLNMLQKKH